MMRVSFRSLEKKAIGKPHFYNQTHPLPVPEGSPPWIMKSLITRWNPTLCNRDDQSNTTELETSFFRAHQNTCHPIITRFLAHLPIEITSVRQGGHVVTSPRCVVKIEFHHKDSLKKTIIKRQKKTPYQKEEKEWAQWWWSIDPQIFKERNSQWRSQTERASKETMRRLVLPSS